MLVIQFSVDGSIIYLIKGQALIFDLYVRIKSITLYKLCFYNMLMLFDFTSKRRIYRKDQTNIKISLNKFAATTHVIVRVYPLNLNHINNYLQD